MNTNFFKKPKKFPTFFQNRESHDYMLIALLFLCLCSCISTNPNEINENTNSSLRNVPTILQENSGLEVTFLGIADSNEGFVKANKAVIYPGEEVELRIRVKNKGRTSSKILLQVWSPSGELARFKHFKISNHLHEAIQTMVGTVHPNESVLVKLWLKLGEKFYGHVPLPLAIKAIKENNLFKVETIVLPVRLRTVR